jgi:aerobic-type carbon monoxide dehydrogenase small subunit (CoxS/CutS family)
MPLTIVIIHVSFVFALGVVVLNVTSQITHTRENFGLKVHRGKCSKSRCVACCVQTSNPLFETCAMY